MVEESLFKAITEGDVDSVRRICHDNKIILPDNLEKLTAVNALRNLDHLESSHCVFKNHNLQGFLILNGIAELAQGYSQSQALDAFLETKYAPGIIYLGYDALNKENYAHFIHACNILCQPEMLDSKDNVIKFFSENVFEKILLDNLGYEETCHYAMSVIPFLSDDSVSYLNNKLTDEEKFLLVYHSQGEISEDVEVLKKFPTRKGLNLVFRKVKEQYNIELELDEVLKFEVNDSEYNKLICELIKIYQSIN